MSGAKITGGEWHVKAHTFKNLDDVVDDYRRLLINGPTEPNAGAFDPSRPIGVTWVGAPDTLPNPPPDCDGTVVVALLGNGPTARANARLIAAAPDLLKAAERVLPILVDLEMRISPETVRVVQEAIRKARGE